MSISDHRVPHIPWGGVVGVIRRHRDEDDEPTIVLDDESIHTWLASGDRQPTAAELPPVQMPTVPALTSLRMSTQVQTTRTATPADVPSMPLQLPMAPLPNTGPDDVAGVSRMPFTVHRDLDDDEALTERLLAMERETRSLADTLAAENDTQMTLLASHLGQVERLVRGTARWLESRWSESWSAQVFERRRARIRGLVPELGHLLADGDVSQETAAAVMVLRSRYLSAADDDSQRLPRLTPERLAVLDRTLGLRRPQAPEPGGDEGAKAGAAL